MADLYLPDVSEWNSVTRLPSAAIVRAAYGTRADKKWPLHAEIAKRDCRWWGAYQYLPRNTDPATAARALASIIGGYRPNVVILDLEEGDGNQLARLEAWHAAIDWPAEWDYSGLYFGRSRGIASQVEWVAAYQRTDPSDAHVLWQFTNSYRFPGIAAPCDASVFHGSVDDLIRLTTPVVKPQTTTPSPQPSAPEDDVSAADVWNAQFKEYADENGNGVRDARSAADFLVSIHALVVKLAADVEAIKAKDGA